MTTNKGFTLLKALGLFVVLAAVGLLVFSIIAGMSAPLIAYNDDGSKMRVYANTVTASDGMKYRVTISTHYEPGKKVFRVVDMYSSESKYANITGIMRSDLGEWNELYACSGNQMGTSTSCPHNGFEAERLLNETVKKTMARQNAIGNMEIFWSWEQGTKEIIDQIKSK